MSSRTISYPVGVALVAAGATCWSLGGALIRLTENIDVWQIIFYRSFTAFVCLTLWFLYRYGRSLPRLFAEAGVTAVIAGLAIGIAGLAFVASLFYTTVAQSIFMVGFSPFLSAILAYWILRERISGITWVAMTIALVGMGIIFMGGSSGGQITGTVLAIYSTFCFSCYNVLLRWGQHTDMSVAVIWNTLIMMLISGAVLLFPIGLRADTGFEQFAIGWRNFPPVLALGAIQITLGLILFTIGSRRVPAAQLALIALVEPTLAPLWAWLAASEVPPIWTFAGGAVILSAIVIQALHSAMKESQRVRTA